ncbi:type II toxin-antitoxin system HicB family antitoxin [Pseudorhodobacter sp.]|uniref:type II toxin-antitoxin system HicB family antitoxin n=1 Tax=Pseudorhodobacter sp. TaxID=1934400 RepID=UPI0039E529E4
MKIFLALVHKDEDSAYGVSFPDIPGCFSAADTLADVVANAAEALDLWFEDEAAIQPRDLDSVSTEVAADLRDGAMLIAVPFIQRTTRQKRVNISLDVGTLLAIDAAADEAKLTRSAFLALAAKNLIIGGPVGPH